MLIIITGTPGAGKSTFAIRLARALRWTRIDLTRYYPQLAVEYNAAKQCYDIDVAAFRRLVKKDIQQGKNYVLDSHISHLLPVKWVDLCIVAICSDLKELKKRLVQRKYSEDKVRENLLAEIFQVCLVDAKERGHKVLVVDTGKKVDHTKILRQIHKALAHKSL